MSDGGAQRYVFPPFHDNDGNLYRGIKVLVTSAGTTNAKTYWTDEAKTSAVNSGVLTDSDNDGIVSAYFDGDYRFRVTQSDDSALDTAIDWDNVKVTSDTATMWEGNFGTSYPTAAASNIWHLFAKTDANNDTAVLGINTGAGFATITDTVADDLEDAISTIGATDTVLAINDTQTLTGNLTIPSNIHLKIGITGSIVTAGSDLTMNGKLEAGLYQIFDVSGGGSVTLGVGSVIGIHPEWWGAIPDNSTDCSTAFQAAGNSVDGVSVGVKGGTIITSHGKYKCNSQVIFEGSISLQGTSSLGSGIYSGQTNADALFLFKNSSASTQSNYVRDIYFYGNGSNHTGGCIEFDSPYKASIERCEITNWGGIGINSFQSETTTCQTVSIRDCRIHQNYKGGVKHGGTTTQGFFLHLEGNSINTNGYYGLYLAYSDNSMVINNEFAGYAYGNTPVGAAHQAVPIAIARGNTNTIMNNSFENNGGTSGTANYNIRTSWNGDTQADDANTTRNLVIMNNDFQGANSNDQDLTHIHFHWAYNATIQGNHFEDAGKSGSFYGIEWGTISAYSNFVFINNEWDATLDGKFTGTTPSWGYRWYDILQSGGVVPIAAGVATSGTGEDDLYTFTCSPDSIGEYGGVRITASGTVTGTNDAKTIKLYFGSTVIGTVAEAAGATDDWIIEATVLNITSSVQRSAVKAWQAGAVEVGDYVASAEDTTAAVIVKITGECANASDSITNLVFKVERIN